MSLSQLLTAVLAVLALGGHGSPASVNPTASDSAAATRDLKRTFELLRGREETLPKPLQSHLSNILYRKRRLSASLVQRETIAGGAAWAFSDRGMLCIAQGGLGSAACTNTRDAIENGVTLGAFSPPSTSNPRPHSFIVIGLMPDSVEDVHITVGHSARLIAVHNTLFSVVSDKRPIIVRRLVRNGQ
jgi:hypothetical protein